MAHFELNGNNEPILIVQMEKGDRDKLKSKDVLKILKISRVTLNGIVVDKVYSDVAKCKNQNYLQWHKNRWNYQELKDIS